MNQRTVNHVNKITMKTIGAQPKARSITEPKVLCDIFGIARAFRMGSSTYGHFHSFLGDFEAVNRETGAITRAQRILLPNIAEGLLIEQMLAAGATPGKEKTNDTRAEDGKSAENPVQFAFSIGVVPQFGEDGRTLKERGQAYEYTLHPLMQTETHDALSDLRGKVAGLLKHEADEESTKAEEAPRGGKRK